MPKFYITFRHASDELRNMFKVIEADNFEEARAYALANYLHSYSMIYHENQWYDYMGVSQEKRFNLKELK